MTDVAAAAPFEADPTLEIAVPKWHQQWWMVALFASLPIIVGYPVIRLFTAGTPALLAFAACLALPSLGGFAYATYVWRLFLTSAERLQAGLSIVGYALVTALAIWVVLNAELNYKPGVVKDYITSDLILKGAWRTVYLSVIAQALGVVLGLLAALGKLAKNPLFNGMASGYIWFFRGTPLLVQLLFWFAALPQIIPAAVNITAFQAAIIGLSVNEGAYMAEIIRAGIQSVDPGQSDAAKSLGMTYPRTMRRIILPQAMRVIIPPTGNNFISMLKSSSLAATITFAELFRTTQTQISTTFRSLELLTVASIWYLVMTTVFSVFQVGLERRFSSGERRDTGNRGLIGTILGSLGGRRV